MRLPHRQLWTALSLFSFTVLLVHIALPKTRPKETQMDKAYLVGKTAILKSGTEHRRSDIDANTDTDTSDQYESDVDRKAQVILADDPHFVGKKSGPVVAEENLQSDTDYREDVYLESRELELESDYRQFPDGILKLSDRRGHSDAAALSLALTDIDEDLHFPAANKTSMAAKLSAPKNNNDAKPLFLDSDEPQSPINKPKSPTRNSDESDQPKAPSMSPYAKCYEWTASELPELAEICPAALQDYAKSAERDLLRNWGPDEDASLPLEELSDGECSVWEQHLCLPNTAASEEEAVFPLAFVIVLDAEVEQTLRLFELIYQPQNSYCFSYDKHNENKSAAVLRSLEKCYPNVIVPKHQETMYWGSYGILSAAVTCLAALVDSGRDWRYVQILSWNDAPLRTNLEMVQLFQLFNGSNDAELLPAQKFRTAYSAVYIPEEESVEAHEAAGHAYRLRGLGKGNGHFLQDLNMPKGTAPGDMTMYKGSFAASMSRVFVEYLVSDEIAGSLFLWLNDTIIPDESLWVTLVHNPGAPGYFPGECVREFRDRKSPKPYMSRHQVWHKSDCKGRMKHGSCIYGIADLPNLATSPCLVAHKFYPQFQPAAWHCLALEYRRRTARPEPLFSEYLRLYEGLPAIRLRRNANLSCEELANLVPKGTSKVDPPLPFRLPKPVGN